MLNLCKCSECLTNTTSMLFQLTPDLHALTVAVLNGCAGYAGSGYSSRANTASNCTSRCDMHGTYISNLIVSNRSKGWYVLFLLCTTTLHPAVYTPICIFINSVIDHWPAPCAVISPRFVLSFRAGHCHSNAGKVVTSLRYWLYVQSNSTSTRMHVQHAPSTGDEFMMNTSRISLVMSSVGHQQPLSWHFNECLAQGFTASGRYKETPSNLLQMCAMRSVTAACMDRRVSIIWKRISCIQFLAIFDLSDWRLVTIKCVMLQFWGNWTPILGQCSIIPTGIHTFLSARSSVTSRAWLLKF